MSCKKAVHHSKSSDAGLQHGHPFAVEEFGEGLAAVTRATLDGKNPGGWFPEQRISLAEAIEACTMGSAYAEYAEKEKGSLTAGKFADIVVLDSELFSLAPEKIKDAKVLQTIVAGKVVFEAK